MFDRASYDEEVLQCARCTSRDSRYRSKELEQQVRARSLPSRIVERSRIVLMSASGHQDVEIAAKLRITPKKLARWRERLQKQGLVGLLKDAPRQKRTPTITRATVQKVIDKTTHEKPANAPHWSTRTMAAATDISEASVRRIWHGHGLKPHLIETFKVSNDPQFSK